MLWRRTTSLRVHHTSPLLVSRSHMRCTNTCVAGATVVVAVRKAFQIRCLTKIALSVTLVVFAAIAAITSCQYGSSGSLCRSRPRQRLTLSRTARGSCRHPARCRRRSRCRCRSCIGTAAASAGARRTTCRHSCCRGGGGALKKVQWRRRVPGEQKNSTENSVCSNSIYTY